MGWFDDNAPSAAPVYGTVNGAPSTLQQGLSDQDYLQGVDDQLKAAGHSDENRAAILDFIKSRPITAQDDIPGPATAPDASATGGWFAQNAPPAATPGPATPSTAAKPPASTSGSSGWTLGSVARGAADLASAVMGMPTAEASQAREDLARGALKGLGSTAVNLGSLVDAIPGVSTVIDRAYGKPGLSAAAIAAARQKLAPADAMQSVGKAGEQAAETLLPAGAIADAGKGLSLAARTALEAGTTAGMAAAQGGSPVIGGVVGATGPALGAIAQRVAPALEKSALTQVEQALGATKERYKAMAARLAPAILKRGLSGSLEQLQSQSADAMSDVGDRLDTAIQQHGNQPVDTQNILSSLEEAKNKFRVISQQPVDDVDPSTSAQILGIHPDGTADVLHEIEPRAIQQLNGLQGIIRGLGPKARADQLIAVRRAWDQVVDQAGGYAQRAPGAIGMPLADTTEAAAKATGTAAIRQQLDQDVPDVSSLNKEYSFWKSLNDVTTQTLQRRAPQKPGLLGQMAEGAGQVVGAGLGLTHGPIGAMEGGFAVGKIAKLAQSTFQSPRWKFASAQTKDALAHAIMDGDSDGIVQALYRAGATGASKVSQ